MKVWGSSRRWWREGGFDPDRLSRCRVTTARHSTVLSTKLIYHPERSRRTCGCFLFSSVSTQDGLIKIAKSSAPSIEMGCSSMRGTAQVVYRGKWLSYFCGFDVPARLLSSAGACAVGLELVWLGAGCVCNWAPGALCATPMAAPETTNSTRRFFALP